MKIVTEKVVPTSGPLCGVKSRKIIVFEEVYTRNELPAEYLNQKNHFYLVIENDDSGTSIFLKGRGPLSDEDLFISQPIAEVKFQQLINYIKVCGERLHDIKVKIKEDNKNWNGKETIEI